MKHYVIKDSNCYYCTQCKKASGDGEGLVGGECIPPTPPASADEGKKPNEQMPTATFEVDLYMGGWVAQCREHTEIITGGIQKKPSMRLIRRNIEEALKAAFHKETMKDMPDITIIFNN